MKSDLEIAQSAKLKPILEIAGNAGVLEDELELYGKYKAKVHLDVLQRLKDRPNGKYIDITAITPTPLGEGKTVNTIGASLGLNKIGKRVFTCIRQPSLGPVFGIKGGAAGGGFSQVVPMEDFNLHLTGDVHAVGLAHNLLAAFIDNHLQKGNKLKIDPHSIVWRRVVDVSDASLRDVLIGLNLKNGVIRQTGYDITVASEVMAILALAEDLQDMRRRFAKIIVAYTYAGKPVTAEDLKCAGAMTVLMKDTVMPTLMQTLEHTPVFVHAGPFANIAHGNSSIIADRLALKLADYVVTESGFGADCGAEKFFNIKCRASGLKPNAAGLVCTVRALKMHSGDFRIIAGKPLDTGLISENIDALERGAANLVKQVENIKNHGIPVVVIINKFATDTQKEIDALRRIAIEQAGADFVALSEVHSGGGSGGVEVAEALVAACEKKSDFRFLYPLEASVKEKIEIIAKKMYGADDVEYSPVAEKKILQITRDGHDDLPICMAKTHLSLSHDPHLKGRPTGFVLPVRDVNLSVGAGFIYPLCGTMRTMPGLPSVPAGEHMDIDENGNVVGLF